MAHSDLVDYSQQQSAPADPVPTASNLILIDNYDSFTWNVYQYLVLEGATVTVYRNDEITLEELIAKQPTQLVVSPGPGHPLTDSGVSKDAIKHFSGKIPILGVCMGEQCIFAVFGGEVQKTGEILHGKTSLLKHDGKGVYAGLPQDLPVTRYHSLAGTHPTLPECLEVTSWVPLGTDPTQTTIMGVRHKEYAVEGVQFHPESILTAEGRGMFKNFLRLQGGTWAANEWVMKQPTPVVVDVSKTHAAGIAVGNKQKNILDQIYDHRRVLVAAQKAIPSKRPEDLQAAYDLGLSPSLISFPDRLKQSPFKLSLMAEIKRASPSKGNINLTACAPAQARTYALAGASVISVLTEPEWFKGSIDDLRSVRQMLEGMPHRPAVLRKEFIFDEYQILEARLAGADTVLLIVKMLDIPTLTRLYKYSQSLGMEPLVEVNNAEEMEIAVKLGSKVIGVNNRNLTSFEVDMDTTTRLMAMISKDITLCALSGIAGPQDVVPYQKAGVGAVLVGEALMRAKDTAGFISELLGGDASSRAPETRRKLLVKICGTRSAEAAKAAVEAGADLIGMILVQGRKRTVSTETALQISQAVHTTAKPTATSTAAVSVAGAKAASFFQHAATHSMYNAQRALLVGVFMDQPLEYILEQQKMLNLDIVQLHGSEPLEWAKLIPVPVIHSFKPGDAGFASPGYHAAPLFDSGAGSGTQLDVASVQKELLAHEGLLALLAGGLTPDNVTQAVESLGDAKARISGVDVSSGVEVDGKQSLDKIRDFVQRAKVIEV